jgi:hypothetical protein
MAASQKSEADTEYLSNTIYTLFLITTTRQARRKEDGQKVLH